MSHALWHLHINYYRISLKTLHLHHDFTSQLYEIVAQFKSHFTFQLSWHLSLKYYANCTRITMTHSKYFIICIPNNYDIYTENYYDLHRNFISWHCNLNCLLRFNCYAVYLRIIINLNANFMRFLSKYYIAILRDYSAKHIHLYTVL